MARTAPKTKDSKEGTPASDILKPKTEKSKVEKAKKAPVKPKAVSSNTATARTATSKKDDTGSKVNDGKEEKVKPVTGDEAVKLIAEYLKVQNRPFSATEVSANLRGKVTKTVADKLMKEMEGRKEIMMKATNADTAKKGTQFVFWAIQVCLYLRYSGIK